MRTAGRSCSAARTRARAARRRARARGRRTAPRSSSGSGSRWRTRHTVWTNARGSAGVTDLGSSQQSDVDEPGAPQSLRGLGVGRVVPRPLPVGEVRRERLLARDLVRERAERVDVAAPAALGDQPAAGLQRAVKRREQRVVIVDPVERGVREDRVDRLGQRRARPGPGRAPWPGRRAPRGRARPSTAPRRPRTRGPRGTRSASSAVTRPEPQPASSTTSSPVSASRSSCSRAHASWGSETRS